MIPKTIHYCWFGGAPKPKSVIRCIDSWKKHCPDFEIREWTENDFDVTQNEYTRQAYESKMWGFVPDYIRLWIIYNYGGIYLDTDVQVIKDLTPLLTDKAFAGFQDAREVALGLGFGAEPNNPFVLEHMRQYETLRFLNPDGSMNKTASPVYTTELLVRKGLQKNNGQIQKMEDISIYPPEFFCPKDFYTGIMKITKNTFSIHQYDSSWFDEKQQAAKKKRWKAKKIEAIVYSIRYFPNRTLMKLLGPQRYDEFKKKLRK